MVWGTQHTRGSSFFNIIITSLQKSQLTTKESTDYNRVNSLQSQLTTQESTRYSKTIVTEKAPNVFSCSSINSNLFFNPLHYWILLHTMLYTLHQLHTTTCPKCHQDFCRKCIVWYLGGNIVEEEFEAGDDPRFLCKDCSTDPITDGDESTTDDGSFHPVVRGLDGNEVFNGHTDF